MRSYSPTEPIGTRMTRENPETSFVKPAIARDPSVYPADEVLSKMTLLKPMRPEIRRLQNRLCAQLKTGR